MIFPEFELPVLPLVKIQTTKTTKMNWNRNVCSAKLLIFNNEVMVVSRGSEIGVVHN
jgi:hypothetical protein